MQPKVELFFNGKSLGAQTIDHKKGTHLACDWQIAYEPGELKAVAYDENDAVIAETVQKSFDECQKNRMQAEQRTTFSKWRRPFICRD